MKSGLILVCMALGISLSSAALACQCEEYKSAQEHIDDADAIFEGKAIKSEIVGRGTVKLTGEPDFHYDVQGTDFRVTRVWKGKVPRVVQLRHSANRGCDLKFDIGKVYKVFARKEKDGTLATDACLHPYITESIEEGWTDVRPWSEYEAVLGPPKKVYK